MARRGQWLDAPFGAPPPSSFREASNRDVREQKLGRRRAARTLRHGARRLSERDAERFASLNPRDG